MNRYISIVLLAGTAAVSAFGEDVVFHKSKTVEHDGREHKVDLLFLAEKKSLVVRKKTSVTEIPYDALEKLAYRYYARRRTREMVGGCLEFPLYCLGITPILFTTSKSHWLYLDYKDAASAGQLVLKLDKSEYQKIISTIQVQTTRNIELLPDLHQKWGQTAPPVEYKNKK